MNTRVGKFRRKLLIVSVTAAIVVGAAAVLWHTAERLKVAEARLGRAEELSHKVLRQMTQYSRELDLALQRAREARRRVGESEALQVQAESRAQRAQREVDQARAETRTTREQIEELRRLRERELERMQKALNQIAPTRRTPLGMVVELANDSFKFDFDKSILRPENREVLSRVAGVLLASTGYRLYVYGHTDDIGTEEYNQALSERRAQAVAHYLIEAGVPSDVVSTKGYGKSSPRVKAATPAARQQNRRVEIGIVDTIITYAETAPNQQQ